MGYEVGNVYESSSCGEYEVIEKLDPSHFLIRFITTGYEVKVQSSKFYNHNIRDKTLPSVYGFGFNNEGKYPASKLTDKGRRTTDCYLKWSGMIERCYSPKRLEINPTYRGCFVNEHWKYYQNFAEFYHTDLYRQPGWHLEKDILVKGNKEYGPDTCVFAPMVINQLFNKMQNSRGNYPIGVHYKKANRRYGACCRDGTGILVHLGYFSNAEDAFYAFKAYKENLIKSVAQKWKSEIDPRLFNAMCEYEIEITD